MHKQHAAMVLLNRIMADAQRITRTLYCCAVSEGQTQTFDLHSHCACM